MRRTVLVLNKLLHPPRLKPDATSGTVHQVGSDAEAMEHRTPLQEATLRLPWLMVTMLIELCAGFVVSRFGDVLKQVILLASFMPVISAISGNVGLQAAAIIVRALDTGQIRPRDWARSLLKELSATLLMALACGVTVHGMRSTFRDWCAEATNTPRELAEAALAHTLRDRVEAAYRRGGSDGEAAPADGGVGRVLRRAGAGGRGGAAAGARVTPGPARSIGTVSATFHGCRAPPRLHVRHGSHRVVMVIETLSVIEGQPVATGAQAGHGMGAATSGGTPGVVASRAPPRAACAGRPAGAGHARARARPASRGAPAVPPPPPTRAGPGRAPAPPCPSTGCARASATPRASV